MELDKEDQVAAKDDDTKSLEDRFGSLALNRERRQTQVSKSYTFQTPEASPRKTPGNTPGNTPFKTPNGENHKSYTPSVNSTCQSFDLSHTIAAGLREPTSQQLLAGFKSLSMDFALGKQFGAGDIGDFELIFKISPSVYRITLGNILITVINDGGSCWCVWEEGKTGDDPPYLVESRLLFDTVCDPDESKNLFAEEDLSTGTVIPIHKFQVHAQVIMELLISKICVLGDASSHSDDTSSGDIQ